MAVEHVHDGSSHGPVDIFLSDAGRIGFLCRHDGAYWETDLPQLTPPGAREGRDGGAQEDAASDLQGLEGMLGGRVGADPMTTAEARDIAVAQLGTRS